ncbi:MAG TPA: RNB domain-containing ribonuclease [Candidatus Bilophila faecipullorum]|uniref:RNB domain-containing ribonuclease n=4 Tax=Bilophila TaxID=35832 RepID=A0A9D1R1A9_9BACT|nr:ribonuclease catalytic domain-containing protein [uncultured Bilophila sp.]HIW79444.1 RNB domain-containing ribonuclease [Candidatus Bilophila faecipullorum]
MIQGLVRYPGAGCVVEFMQGNAPQIAWVLEEQNGRLRLLLPNRRETALQTARILPWPGPAYDKNCSRDAALDILERHKSRRDVANVDPLELWELAQGEVEQAPAEWFAELALSEPDMDAVAACGHALLQAKSHFKFNPPNFEVYPESVVAARLAEQEAARKREELVGKGSAFIRLLWDIHQKKSKASPEAAADALEPEVRERLRRTILSRIADPETSEDEALWKLIVKGLPDEPFMPLHLAQAWGLVPPHHNYWMDRAGYAPGDAWSEEHKEAVEELLRRADEDAQAEPTFPDRPIISIDAPTTRDVDDAFFIEARPEGGWNLTIALACPAFRWPFGEALDKAVFSRATSVYLPEATHHMLPEALGTGAYSLLAGKTRPSLLVDCAIGEDGLVTACAPRLGYAKLAANLCYEDCEAALDGGENAASPYLEQLRQALALAEAHQQRRIEKGAVIIERPDQIIRLEGEGENVTVFLEEDAPAPKAHLLVSELMVLTNAALAAWAAEHGVALLHRTQDVALPKEYAGIWKAPVDVARVVRAMAPAVLETSPRPHAGLGEAAYAPSTSPLRRYPDLINETQIISTLHDGKPRWSKEELDALLPVLNAHLDAAGQVQRFRPRYWKLLYFKQQGDRWWPAVITDENDAFVTVNLPKEQMVVRARRQFFGERTHPGQELEIRLGKVHPLHNEFQLVETREI